MLLLLLFLRSDTVSASQTFLLIISSVSSRVSHSVWAQKRFWSEVWDLKRSSNIYTLILALYSYWTGVIVYLCFSWAPAEDAGIWGHLAACLAWTPAGRNPSETEPKLKFNDWLAVCSAPKIYQHLTVTRQTQHSRTHNTHNDHQSSSSYVL